MCFNSCSKSDTQSAIILPTDEFIKYKVNGTNYSFVMPADTVFSGNQLNNPPPPPTTVVFANRIPASNVNFVNIQFERSGVTAGSTPALTFFSIAQMDFYPIVVTSANPVRITITEYGNVGEYIAGNFSGLFIGPSPNNNQYNITASFRVKRII